MPDVPRLLWDHYARITRGPFHIARVKLPAGRGSDLHRHDFAELFFVEHGHGTHLINGDRMPLARGDLTFIRAEDCHAFETGSGLTFVNVAMPMTVVEELERRYF